MQENNIKLFEQAYAHKPEIERAILSAAVSSVVLHLAIMLYLLLLNEVRLLFIILYLLTTVVFVGLVVSYWFERRPGNRKHLTLTAQGVRYRAEFLQKELEFDWEEVDKVQLGSWEVVFILKNEERHKVSLTIIADKENLQCALDQIRRQACHRQIEVA